MSKKPEQNAGSRPDLFSEQTASDDDQTLADREQSASDTDQTGADQDQAASDSDQESADDDQDASDEDLQAGGDPAVHLTSRLARERASRKRSDASVLRDEDGMERFLTAEDRDHAAELRDRGAARRDTLARLHDEQDDTDASREAILVRGEHDRARAAADRVKASNDRARAAAERLEASHERVEAQRLLAAAEAALTGATTDELTGARSRQYGMEEIARELRRAHRTETRLVLAFIDVDGLKQVNDTQGHPSGDALLRRTGEALLAGVRAYDLVVRYGGDEFICAMPNVTEGRARLRFEKIAATLASIDPDHSITYGLSEAQPGDGLADLIAHADSDLLSHRSTRVR
jgi:diguanylate cyclase (GGDEF)-like protein